MKIFFIDGYNVLHTWPELKNEKNYSFAAAREKLINIMHNYAACNESKVVIVFDGYKVPGNIEGKEVINKYLTVVFTKDGETADSYIEREVSNLGRRYEVYVVTSDWLEQQTIFQRGAVRVSSIEFHNDVIKVQKEIKKIEKEKIVPKNHLQDNIDSDVLEKLEQIRRSNLK